MHPVADPTQILGAVLNMSHFLCPSSTTPHYIFGPPDAFNTTCSELDLDVLATVPIEPEISGRGDKGWPVVMSGGPDAQGEAGRKAFMALGEQVWNRIRK